MSYRRSFIKSIQQGTITLTGGGSTTGTSTLGTAVDTTKAVVMLLGATYNVAGPNQPESAVSLTLTNGTTVTADRNTANGSLTVGFVVIEYMPFAVRSLQRGSITNNATTATAAISAVVVAKSQVIFAGYRMNLADDRSATRLDLTSTILVTSTRDAGATGTTITPYQVIEFV